MKNLIVAMFVMLCGAQFASAAAVNAGGGKKAVASMRDNSGYPIAFSDDKPWKVFESTSTNPIQLVDESGVAPKQGMIKRICLESAPAIPSAIDNAIIWDTVTAADISATGAGRRLVPPIQRVSGVEKCVEINALFTSGVGIDQNAAGSVYIYWRELGGYR